MRANLAGVCLITAALAPAAWAVAQDGPATAITDIRQESGEGSTRLILETTGPIAYTTYSPDPLTLVVDITDVDASKLPARINVGTPEVESVRVSNLARADGRSLARVEVRLASLVPYRPVSRDGKGLVLVFERPATVDAGNGPASATTAQTAAPVAAAPPARPAAKPVAPVAQMVAAPVSGAGSGRRATSILGVSRDEDAGLLAFTVKADGRLEYRDFLLPSPDRLVLDFPDVVARANVRTLPVGEDPVRKVRLGQFSAAAPKVARLVLDLTHKTPYRIIDGSDGVRIVFGDSATAERGPQAPLAALRASADPEPAVLASAVPVARPGALEPLALPEPQTQASPAASSAPEEPAEPSNVGMACGQTGDLGTPISLDFRDGDLLDIFRLFSDISGLNVVVNPGVSGKVTLRLNEVPWGRALELILKTNGLGCVLEDNVIRIAPLSALQKRRRIGGSCRSRSSWPAIWSTSRSASPMPRRTL